MLAIKDIKNSQVFWAKDPKTGKVYDFKAFGNPSVCDGKLVVECTDSGDYIYMFDENHAEMLYATKPDGVEAE